MHNVLKKIRSPSFLIAKKSLIYWSVAYKWEWTIIETTTLQKYRDLNETSLWPHHHGWCFEWVGCAPPLSPEHSIGAGGGAAGHIAPIEVSISAHAEPPATLVVDSTANEWKVVVCIMCAEGSIMALCCQSIIIWNQTTHYIMGKVMHDIL